MPADDSLKPHIHVQREAEKVQKVVESNKSTTIMRDLLRKPLVDPNYQPRGGLLGPDCGCPHHTICNNVVCPRAVKVTC